MDMEGIRPIRHFCFQCHEVVPQESMFLCRCSVAQHKPCSGLRFAGEKHLKYCDYCLKYYMALPQGAIPDWVRDLFAVDVRIPCKNDRFCAICLVSFCNCSSPMAHHHETHPNSIVKIHLKGGHTFVAESEIGPFCNYFAIQSEIDTSPRDGQVLRLVPLHPMPPVASSTRNCLGCGSLSIRDSSLFCSMSCKFKKGGCKSNRRFTDTIMEEDFNSTHMRDRFCINCRTHFCWASCSEQHRNHPYITITENDGLLFARIPARKWLSYFGSVQMHNDGDGLLLLTVQPVEEPQ